MSQILPPDLRVVCRKLASIPQTQLHHSLPSLVNHVLNCRKPLSTPQDPKAKGEASESAILVNRLKTTLTTLLTSRIKEARFAAISLVKAAVDVGGWEVIKGCEPWVRGLLSIVQKNDPLPSKELAIVALTKIYMLVRPYQTLVREIATSTIPAFGTACLQILKAASTDISYTIPPSALETICDSFYTLIPLYPATFRPFSSQSHAAIKQYLAPTTSDSTYVPVSLQLAARRLAIQQHHVAAKSGGSDEWLKHIDAIIIEFHSTADQVFRAVDESWEPSSAMSRSTVIVEEQPCEGSLLPKWSGIQAGSERMIGLLQYLSECLRCSTKGLVSVPLSKITDIISRVCLIARLTPGSQTWEQSLQTRAAIGREEKEELWSSLPDIHIAALQLSRTLFQRLDRDMLPLASELTHHVARVLNSGISNTSLRSTTYSTMNQILTLAGPTLSRPVVEMLGSIVTACCRDLQEDTGYLKQPTKITAAGDTKKNSLTANADLFLQTPKTSSSSSEEHQVSHLESAHREAASNLLSVFLSSIPQKHLKPRLRGLLDQTAILTRNRDAMLASVLNPYTDSRGRRYASILPHLTSQFPNDQALEIIRTNLRTDAAGLSSGGAASFDDEEPEEEYEDEEMSGGIANDDEPAAEKEEEAPAGLPVLPPVEELTIQNNPFETRKTNTPVVHTGFANVQRASSPPKRKHDGSSPIAPKRQELEREPVRPTSEKLVETVVDGDDDDDESVHLNMELEDDDEDDDDNDDN